MDLRLAPVVLSVVLSIGNPGGEMTRPNRPGASPTPTPGKAPWSDAQRRIPDFADGVRLIANYIRFRVCVRQAGDGTTLESPTPLSPGHPTFSADQGRPIPLLRGHDAGLQFREHLVRVNSATATAIAHKEGWTYMLTAKHVLLPEKGSRPYKRLLARTRRFLAVHTGVDEALITPTGTKTAILAKHRRDDFQLASDLHTVCVSNQHDIAVLRTAASWDFEPPEIGDSSVLDYGDEIYLYGYHHGRGQLQLTKGIVSRPLCHGALCVEETRHIFGTDAKANPTLSGGPVYWRHPNTGRFLLVGLLLGGHTDFLEPLHEALAVNMALHVLRSQKTSSGRLLRTALGPKSLAPTESRLLRTALGPKSLAPTERAPTETGTDGDGRRRPPPLTRPRRQAKIWRGGRRMTPRRFGEARRY